MDCRSSGGATGTEWVGARDAGEHPARRKDPFKQEDPAPKVRRVEVEHWPYEL